MPLHDHFRLPMRDDCPWEGFHSAWTNAIVALLNQRVLPRSYRAIPQTHAGTRVEMDVGTFHLEDRPPQPGNGIATLVWPPPQTPWTALVDFADRDTFEVRVRDGNRRLVAAVELVSPGNKDRPQSRRDFAIKCASYLQQHVAVIIIDVVTERQDNLHGVLMRLLDQPPLSIEAVTTPLYGVAYRVALRDDNHYHLEMWPQALAVGQALPTLPLWLSDDLAVPLDLEATYRTAFEVLRLED